MKIRLHNKYEVTCGDKTYVAYNTMLKSVFDKIKNLEPYNSYFAFGTGSNAVNFETSKLGSYVATYAATTEQVQPDCKAGDMFVIKSKVFGENEGNGLTFSEQICEWFGSNAPAIEDTVAQVTKQISMTLI